jgi:aspartate aminotransferase-like enzyme
MATVEVEALAPSQPRLASAGLLRLGPYVFKRASTPTELDGVHRLNYQTFVREIRQHEDNGAGFLVDKFHDKNVYFIALRAEQVIGMVCVHDRPPFSTADRLSDPRVIAELGERLLEVRLLAVDSDERHGLVFAGLIWTLYEYARARYTHLLISGVQNRVTLYEKFGFRPLGPAVQSGHAEFVPMVMDLSELPPEIRRDMMRWKARLGIAPRGGPEADAARHDRVPATESPANTASDTLRRPEPLFCLLPGPVQIAASVREVLSLPPVSHRGAAFVEWFESTRRTLSELVGGLEVGMMCGSGTLANDAIAATLAADRSIGRGLILVNGEFGERLVDHARRFGLNFRILSCRWGDPWDFDELATALHEEPDADWLWAVHLESSTGVLNDLAALRRRLAGRPVRLCLDCVSSLGAVPLDLRGVHLASGVSGKSLGSFAGIAIVFAGPAAFAGVRPDRIPTYLDVPAAIASTGSRFTFPSPLLRALARALDVYATPARRQARFSDYAELGRFVRRRLRDCGLEPLAAEPVASPVITTFLPPAGDPAQFLARCRSWGFELAGESSYLRERGWVQIATMGDVTREACRPFFEQLDRLAGAT